MFAGSSTNGRRMSIEIGSALKMRIFLVRAFDRLCRLPKWRKLDKVLTQAAERSSEFFFVQIGANDGVIYDPIYQYVNRYGWDGLLVEPVGCYFKKLKANYRNNPQLAFENVALSDKQETRNFYRIQEGLDFLPAWCHGLGTFHLDVLLTHKWAIPNIEDYVVTEQVNCLTLASLLHKHAVRKIDLLVIDTEGHDYHIIEQIDFGAFRPKILLFEHQYLNVGQKADCERLLQEQRYTVSKHMGNTLAYLEKELGF
jgi:FkbM family methyltransferase